MKRLSAEFLQKVEEKKPDVYEYLKDGYNAEEMYRNVFLPKVAELEKEHPEASKAQLGDLGLNALKNVLFQACCYLYTDESSAEKRDKDLTFPTAVWSKTGEFWAAPPAVFSGWIVDLQEEVEKLQTELLKEDVPTRTEVRFVLTGEQGRALEVAAALWGESPAMLMRRYAGQVASKAVEDYEKTFGGLSKVEQLSKLEAENARLRADLKKFEDWLGVLPK